MSPLSRDAFALQKLDYVAHWLPHCESTSLALLGECVTGGKIFFNTRQFCHTFSALLRHFFPSQLTLSAR
ncbi:hypothetical protein ACTXT7_013318 [Hymenolepis weldensis]